MALKMVYYELVMRHAHYKAILEVVVLARVATKEIRMLLPYSFPCGSYMMMMIMMMIMMARSSSNGAV